MFRLALLALFLTMQDRPPELCQLSGTVTSSSGEPLTRVEITAEPAAGGSAARTSTDAKGNFTLVDLKPGEYRLKGARSGYLGMYYGARRSHGQGSALLLTPGQRIGDLGIRLIPYAVIAGAVRESDGEPVVDAEVQVFQLHYRAEGAQLQFAGRAATDDLGQYRIHDLAPGKYIAAAKPANARPDGRELPEDHSPNDAVRERLAGQAYGGSAMLAGARTVIVDEGGRVAGVDFTLTRNRVFHVKGQVSIPQGTYADVSLLSGGSAEHEIEKLVSRVRENGEFDFPAVTAGPYILQASARKKEASPEEGVYLIDSNDQESRATMPIDITRDVDGLRIAVAPNAEIAGHIIVEDAGDLKLPKMFAYFHTATEIFPGAPLKDGAAFSKTLPNGHYQIYAGSDDGMKALVVRSIRSESVDVLREGLTLQGPSKLPVEIVLAPDAASLDGLVFDNEDKPAASATVVAIPESALRRRADRYFAESTDAQGRFRMKYVPPGKYIVFAWADIEPNAWFDPEFVRPIESRGETVKLESQAHGSVKLHLMQ